MLFVMTPLLRPGVFTVFLKPLLHYMVRSHRRTPPPIINTDFNVHSNIKQKSSYCTDAEIDTYLHLCLSRSVWMRHYVIAVSII